MPSSEDSLMFPWTQHSRRERQTETSKPKKVYLGGENKRKSENKRGLCNID